LRPLASGLNGDSPELEATPTDRRQGIDFRARMGYTKSTLRYLSLHETATGRLFVASIGRMAQTKAGKMNNRRTDTPCAPKSEILVVDDDLDILNLLSQILVGEEYEVRTATGGPQALAAVREVAPDLILLDIMMPKMDGYQVCQHLKADPETRDIPVIFLSAIGATRDKVKAFTVGGVDYITKPFQIQEVIARVETHLSLRALQRQLQSARDELARQLEELRARNEELDALANAIARDLKTPLTSIVGHADTLRELYDKLSEEDLREFLDTIASNGRKMDKIIDDLLLLAGVRQTERVDIRPLDMAGIVEGALQRMADVVEKYQAEIVLPPSWPAVVGHGPWVEEVWVSYISNAIEYGGRPPRVELGATAEEGDIVRFWVRDNGPGLSPEEQERLFAPLEKRGLGLVIVQRIMEKLGRKAKVKSSPDRGSTFSFTLRRR